MSLVAAAARRIALGPRAQVIELGAGVTRITLATRVSRAFGFSVCCYRLGPLLVDSGFAHAAPALADLLGFSHDEPDRARRGGPPRHTRGVEVGPIEAIALTHHHEDHSGCAGLLQRHWGCPVYLAHPQLHLSEGVGKLVTYRQLYWGAPAPYQPTPMPRRFTVGRRTLRALATPGHCASHVVLFEEASGLLFSGDLLVSPTAGAIMSHEQPLLLARSLRAAAALDPRRMLTGHGAVHERPRRLLLAKAEALERAAERIQALFTAGCSPARITGRIFERGARRDWLKLALTQGEFGRYNLVMACLPGRGAVPRAGRRRS